MAEHLHRKQAAAGSSPALSTINASLAQLAVQRPCKAKVGGSNPTTSTICARGPMDKASVYETEVCRFNSCRALHYGCGLEAKTAVSKTANLRSNRSTCANQQPVGKSGRSCLTWNQEIAGSNPAWLTIAHIAQWQSSALVRRRPRFNS